MRKFYLHTADKSTSFDLNTKTALATDPQGLGTSFDTSYGETNDGKYLTNIKPSFDPIVLKIYFNADGSSGYVNYKNLTHFFNVCGKKTILFEYDDGVTDKYCDVIFKSLTKTEISSEGLFVETLTLERQSYFYEIVEKRLSIGYGYDGAAFPLSFPITFDKKDFSDSCEIRNDFYLPAEIKMIITASSIYNLNIRIETLDGDLVSEMLFPSASPLNGKIEIDPSTKKITITRDNGTIEDGYYMTDKTKQSFLYLPPGVYNFVTNITRYSGIEIKLSIRRYMFD